MTPIETDIQFFSVKELACKGAGIVKLDPRFAHALVALRVGTLFAVVTVTFFLITLWVFK